MSTAVTLFSGGGCATLGLRAAGYRIVGAVEYDPQIAACYAQNVGPVEVVDLARAVARFFARWIGVDLLQVSPPCPNFSSAKTGGRETPLDYRLAGAVCRALRVMRPATFLLENVRGYAHSASYARIRHTLAALGYEVRARIVNSADYGVPQTRERLILLASRVGVPRFPRQTHADGGGLGMAPWIGWYAAIEDLIPTLPASQFAPWQLPYVQKYLEQHGPAAALDEGSGAGHLDKGGIQINGADDPAWTIRASHRGDSMRALLWQQTNCGGGDRRPRREDDPAFTLTTGDDRESHIARALLIPSSNTANWSGGMPVPHGHTPAWVVTTDSAPRALLLDGQESNTPRHAESPAFSVPGSVGKGTPRAFVANRSADKWGDGVRHAVAPMYTVSTHTPERWRAWLEQGRVVQLTPRALARFQTIPDSYTLPDKASLACRIIGNGVPCLLVQRLGEALRDRAERIAA